MTYYDHLFRQLKTIYHPVISPYLSRYDTKAIAALSPWFSLLIGLNMYAVIEQEKYTHIPVVVAFPVAYTGYHIGKYVYKIGTFEDELRSEIRKMFKPE